MTKITSVSMDVGSDSVTIKFDDGSEQVITAPIAPATQGVSLEDLQKVDGNVKTAETDIEEIITKETGSPEVNPATITSTEGTSDSTTS